MMKSNAIKGYLNSDIIIKPDLKRFSAMKTDGMLEMIEEGYRATKALIPNIKENKGKLYFHFENKQRVVITKGEELFQETIGILNKTKPMNKLIWNNLLKINIPHCIKKITNGYIENLMINKRRELKNQFNQITFTIDIFSNPILSAIFQITDETFHSERRNAILNPSFSYYAVFYREETDGKFFSISTFA